MQILRHGIASTSAFPKSIASYSFSISVAVILDITCRSGGREGALGTGFVSESPLQDLTSGHFSDTNGWHQANGATSWTTQPVSAMGRENIYSQMSLLSSLGISPDPDHQVGITYKSWKGLPVCPKAA